MRIGEEGLSHITCNQLTRWLVCCMLTLLPLVIVAGYSGDSGASKATQTRAESAGPTAPKPDPRCSAYDLTSPHREELYQLMLYANPSWYSSPQHVKDFQISKFSALEAHYLALRVLFPAVVDGITFGDYLSEFNLPTIEGWRLLFADILDLAKSVQTPSTCGPEEAAYELLRYHGANILSQAVTANISPVVASSAREGIASRLAQCRLANKNLQCNQAEFVRQEVPRYEDILSTGLDKR